MPEWQVENCCINKGYKMLTSPNVVFMDNQQLTASNITVSSENSDYPKENMIDTVRSRVFKPADAATNIFNITIDLGSNATCNFLGIVSPLEDYFTISDAATITIEANNINDFVSPPFSTTATPELTGVFKFFDESVDTDYRYWKISFDDSTNPTTLSIGYIYLGDLTQLTSRTVSKGFSTSAVDPSKADSSMNGTLYFDEKQRYHMFNGLSLGYIPAADRRTLEKLFYDNGKSSPMFVSLDPNLKVSEEYGELTKLMRFETQPSVQHHFDDVYSMSFSMREVV
jgi:hypothetical protein